MADFQASLVYIASVNYRIKLRGVFILKATFYNIPIISWRSSLLLYEHCRARNNIPIAAGE